MKVSSTVLKTSGYREVLAEFTSINLIEFWVYLIGQCYPMHTPLGTQCYPMGTLRGMH